MISTDCWKYRHISVSVETNSQGTDQEMAEHVRETGDGGVDRYLNHLNVKNLILSQIYAIANNFARQTLSYNHVVPWSTLPFLSWYLAKTDSGIPNNDHL